MKEIVNFLFEVGILSKTPRSGFHFLGNGEQSVSEHINRVVFIGYTLASMEPGIDMLKVLKMCLLHDIAESRVSDLNYVHQKYVNVEEERAIEDLAKTLPFGDDIRSVLKEYHERTTKEAILAKDADILELMLSLKEQIDTGNKKAETWMEPVVKRVKSESAKKLAQQILETHSDDWWYDNKEGSWWITRNKK